MIEVGRLSLLPKAVAKLTGSVGFLVLTVSAAATVSHQDSYNNNGSNNHNNSNSDSKRNALNQNVGNAPFNKSVAGNGKGVMTEVFKNLNECLTSLGRERAFPNDGSRYCNGTWDTILCWPAAPVDSVAKMPCPVFRGLDPNKFAYKRCGINGTWEGRYPGDNSAPWGWTNFTNCLTPLYKETYKKYYEGKTEYDVQRMKDIVAGTRLMEMIGLVLSLIALTLSIFIFTYFRSLKCNRTRIHRNLFIAMIIQVTILLVVYTDQYIAKFGPVKDQGLISNTYIVCELLYALVEYTKSVMFMWMFIEGVYLHDMIAMSVFSGQPYYVFYYLIGWGIPVVLTITWGLTTGFTHYEKCWWGYPYLPSFWILEGPRAAVVAVNLIFLLNIVRVLVTKLRESHSNEALQVRKAVKAAIVLLPLLGISNFITMIPEPTDDPVKFGFWSYISHFLTSFQGLFISLLYCFLNGEVQQTLKKHWERYQMSRRPGYVSGKRRLSRTLSVFTSVTEMPYQVRRTGDSSPSSSANYTYLKKGASVPQDDSPGSQRDSPS
ncbi:PDF receptor-like [Tubulanus polymorphus]|uniref:PDF receptor-like n=1 Tax=Tubulanus polymorphus TaxID=672921 RepID=UPI003DA3284B